MEMTTAGRSDMMTDADLMDAIQALGEQEQNDKMKELLKMMNDNRIISWEEAEQIMACDACNGPIKSSLPPQSRPMEPDNDTDVDWSIQQLQRDNPKLKQVNLNNMKRTPIPQVKRLLSAIKDNTHLEKIALANMGLHDNDCEPIFEVVTCNRTLKSINLETNYLSGHFFARLFKAALVNQTLEEVKAVNQGVTFATAAEKEIIDAVFENRGLTKVSINLRLPEGRHKIENALIRNQEIRRILRRQAAAAAVREAEELQVVAKAETQSRTAERTRASAILDSASGTSLVAHVVGDSTVGTNSNLECRTVSGNAARVSCCIVGNDERIVGEEEVIVGASCSRTDPMNRATSKETELKVASTKTMVNDAIADEKYGKSGPKETPIRKKISVEQAVPEIELDTDQVLGKTSVSKETSLTAAAAKKSFATLKTNKAIPDECIDSIFSRSQNNSCSVKSNSRAAVSGEEVEVTRKNGGTRSSSLVPPIFLVSEQKNGPMRRNFSIASRKNSSELKKIASKLNELSKPAMHSVPLNSSIHASPIIEARK